MAVYDCSLFFNENDIFEIRLNQHWDFVDRFIVVEAGETHTGLKKTLNFDHERFRPWASKIEYRSFESFSETIPANPEYFDVLDSTIHDHKLEWVRDNFQGNYCFKVLKEIGAQDEDLVYLSPPDEMISKEAFERARARFSGNDRYTVTDASGRVTAKDIRPMFRFGLDLYIYKFNLLSRRNEIQPIITTYGNHKKVFPSLARNVNLITHPPIDNAGWHFSYADDTNGERVLTKMKSWAHATDPGQGLNGTRRMDTTSAIDAVQILVNQFDMKIVPIEAESHPEYIINNQERFANYILQE
jgi:beta-1,4-mannosyl-glycoprotein beta-1,4-N-acetylglucosaminyltransferase